MENVYFTWPDRRFRYECRGCGACCKGHGIGIDVAGGQLTQLVARRPAITAFLREYQPSGYDGHFVVFKDPDAKADLAAFLADVAQGQVPKVGH